MTYAYNNEYMEWLLYKTIDRLLSLMFFLYAVFTFDVTADTA